MFTRKKASYHKDTQFEHKEKIAEKVLKIHLAAFSKSNTTVSTLNDGRRRFKAASNRLYVDYALFGSKASIRGTLKFFATI